MSHLKRLRFQAAQARGLPVSTSDRAAEPASGTVLERILARSGKTPETVKFSTRTGQVLRRMGVRDTKELRRVYQLPRRAWSDEDIETLVEGFTDMFKVLDGEQVLRPVQGMSLGELHDRRGLIGAIGCGKGKTLITRLAPLVVEAKKPLLVLPAAHIREKIKRDFAELDHHWQRPENLKIVSYTKLGRVEGAEFLDKYQPDLIIADEVHKLKNRRAAVTKRVGRYMAEHPDTIFVGLSGTITRRSLLEFHHLLLWAFGHEQMPMPLSFDEAEWWARALDVRPEGQPLAPGALRVFEHDDLDIGSKKWKQIATGSHEFGEVERARVAFSERLRSTSGVVSTTSSDVGASLILEWWRVKPHPLVMPFLEAMQGTPDEPGVGPNGESIADPAQIWRYTRQLVCGGFYLEWDPPPPRPWLELRKDWNRFVYRTLFEELPGADSPFQIQQLVSRGRLNDGGTLKPWQSIRDTYKPRTVARWLTRDVLETISKKATDFGTCLLWTEWRALGEELAKTAGLKFFHEGGCADDGTYIESLAGSSSAVLSIQANGEGRNLQAWHRNVIVSPPPNGGAWEQMLARTHREGQEADEVHNLVIVGHEGIEAGIDQAFRDAKYSQQVLGQPQKLILADCVGRDIFEQRKNKEK